MRSRPISNRVRIAITAATALAFGVQTYADAREVALLGIPVEIWQSSALKLALLVLPVLGVFLVNRWWAVLPALVPTAVMAWLYATGYDPPWSGGDAFGTPWEEDPFESPEAALLWAVLASLAVSIQAAILSLGLLPRAGWKWIRSKHLGADRARG
ncbi:MAG TPA: hypothetical protein VFY48_08575 [Solirubrobacterales bacterium]|nr:hypothetical protein [Solirubrobacterales bacterium]